MKQSQRVKRNKERALRRVEQNKRRDERLLFESAFADPNASKISPDVSEDEEVDSGSEYYSEFSSVEEDEDNAVNSESESQSEDDIGLDQPPQIRNQLTEQEIDFSF
jgi:hypothetical protein